MTRTRGDDMSRQWRPGTGWIEVAVGVGLFAISVGEIATTKHWRGPAAVSVIAAAFITLPLAVGRRYPVAVVTSVLAATSIWSLLTRTPQSIGVFFALLAVSFTAGLRIDHRRVVFLSAAAITTVVAALRTQSDSSPGDYSFTFGLMLAAYVLGVLARRRNVVASSEAERADRAEEQQELVTQVALQDERARIARELHDVIAHAVSVIVVQSVGGRAMIGTDNAQAVGAFEVIEATGQDALREMRRLLDVLRTADESALLEPQPALDQLTELMNRAAATGLRPQLDIVGTPQLLPAAVELSAYRIVQEALTNALKHGGPCVVHVRVEYAPTHLRLEIRNWGANKPSRTNDERRGHGVVGMQERAALCGGTLTAHPQPTGDFVVKAELPVTWS